MKPHHLISLVPLLTDLAIAEVHDHDSVIYGGTSAGLVAGFQAKAMGKSVVVLEPSHHLGGLTTGGLGQTDIGNKSAIGGLSREFYRKVRKHYENPANWKWQKPDEYRSGGQSKTDPNEDTMWTFEPSAASTIFATWIADTGLEVVKNAPMKRGGSGVIKDGSVLKAIVLESGDEYRGKVFLDATYEGDLLAEAGVDYIVGREAKSEFGETLNGVQPADHGRDLRGNQARNGIKAQFVPGVDPYVVKGDPASGLLPFVEPGGPGEQGAGDHRVQAYCFRGCYTDHPDNRTPWIKPEGYDERDYELLLRNFEAGEDRIPWINSRMPNRKTDTNNEHGFSSDFIGQNYGYPEASYEERRKIEDRHRRYQQGLMWTLANHPRVPEKIRSTVSQWGTCKDEFTAEGEPGDGWQFQIYVREGRRMRGEMVMSQKHCESLEVVTDSIGMGAYNMDSHHVKRYVDADGQLRNEGQVTGFISDPYPISYRSMLPKRDQAANLLVPVALSSTHIAFGSIRMEPVFMVTGQSAATAAVMSLDRNTPLHEIDVAALQQRLRADDQVLTLEDRIQ